MWACISSVCRMKMSLLVGCLYAYVVTGFHYINLEEHNEYEMLHKLCNNGRIKWCPNSYIKHE